MDSKEFSEFSRAAIDFVIKYTESLRNRDVLPAIQPGYLSQLLPEETPEKGERWQDVLKDFEQYILPGVTHWNSPHFHAFYPTGNSFPSIVGDILSSGLSCVGFSWLASPACTELEVITLNWLGKSLGLPEQFLNCSEGPGGGVIQGSASESTLVCLLAAKEYATRRIKRLHPDWEESIIKTKLVAYTSDQSNSSVEKSGLLGSMPMRLLPVDDKCSLRGETLLRAVKEDIDKGLIPCYVVATLGTTGTCAFDNLDELGPVCKEYDLWLHIDAAYAGAAFICPEYRHLMSGIEYGDSFNVNPHKWLLVNFDCSALWIRDSRRLIEALNIERIYLSHDKEGLAPDYRNWQIPLGRRFRSLKLWIVLRLYGEEGLRAHIRHTIKLAKMFKSYVQSDSSFELILDTSMGLVCFRMKGDNELTKELLARLTARRKIYIVAAMYKEKMVARFTICSELTKEEDITFAWNEISEQAREILRSRELPFKEEPFIPFAKSTENITARIENLKLEEKSHSQKIL